MQEYSNELLENSLKIQSQTWTPLNFLTMKVANKTKKKSNEGVTNLSYQMLKIYYSPSIIKTMVLKHKQTDKWNTRGNWKDDSKIHDLVCNKSSNSKQWGQDGI